MLEDDFARRKPAQAAEISMWSYIGGGWAGWGAKITLRGRCSRDLIDGRSIQPASQPSQPKSGKTIEAGTRGFWMDISQPSNALQRKISTLALFSLTSQQCFFGHPDGLSGLPPVFGSSPGGQPPWSQRWQQ